MSTRPATVFVVDDDPDVRRALARLLGAAGCEVDAFGSAAEFLAAYDPDVPGCLLLDAVMPGIDGLELQRALRAATYTIPIVFLSGSADIPMSVQAMKAGAVTFLTKPVDDSTLIAAVTDALNVDEANRRARTLDQPLRRRLSTLTPREREVLAHVVAGQLNKQIAADLGTAEKTVKVHRSRVMRKMGARSVAELVQLANRVGIAANPESWS